MSIYVGPEEIHTLETLANQLHCPRCTARFAESGFASAFWQAEAITYFAWCGACAWLGDITEITNVVGYEPIEEEDYGE